MRKGFKARVNDTDLVLTSGGQIIVATTEQELAEVPDSWMPFDLDTEQVTVTDWLNRQRPDRPNRTPPLQVGGTPRRIPHEVLSEIDAFCRRTYPREGCGMAIGRDIPGYPLVFRNVNIYNTSPTPRTAYRFSKDVQLGLYRTMDEEGWDPLLIWHSHTNGAEHTHPSDTDLDLATEPNAVYLILAYDPPEPVPSLVGTSAPRFRTPQVGWWQIRDGVAREVVVELVD